MRSLPRGGFLGKLVNLARAIGRMDIPRHASSTSYFIVMAVFPALVLLLSILRYTAFDVENLIAMLDGIFPDALLPYAKRIIRSTYQSTSGVILGASAVIALWSSSRGIFGLLCGLNHIYDVSEDRGFLRTRLISVAYTFAFIVVLLLTLILHVFGTTILSWIPPTTNPLLLFLTDVIDLRFFLLLGIQTVFFTAMYMVFPNRRNSLSDSLPGALLASIGWLVFSDLFSIYVEYFPYYANIYGSVYAVALSMLWLYSCVSIVYYGGALNRLLMLHGEKAGE